MTTTIQVTEVEFNHLINGREVSKSLKLSESFATTFAKQGDQVTVRFEDQEHKCYLKNREDFKDEGRIQMKLILSQ